MGKSRHQTYSYYLYFVPYPSLKTLKAQKFNISRGILKLIKQSKVWAGIAHHLDHFAYLILNKEIEGKIVIECYKTHRLRIALDLSLFIGLKIVSPNLITVLDQLIVQEGRGSFDKVRESHFQPLYKVNPSTYEPKIFFLYV
ncbi:MAG: hypothetical protein WBX01_04070 [Nitrososphaeraceae archaeon]